MEPLFPLLVNLSTTRKEYVLFLGAGISKDAGIPSGWDILIETLKPLYISDTKVTSLPQKAYEAIEKWYVSHPKYSKLGYSDVLELIYKGDLERREFLRTFFANKLPGNVHKAISLLVKHKLVRFIFTTNFDNLLEKALEESAIDYDVIFSDDILKESKSWDKVSDCRIYKLHGDFNSGKVRNTISELKELDPLIAEDFQYIINRHGIITIGYSGRDFAIMQHFKNRPPFHYPMYWQHVSFPPNTDEYQHFHELVETYKNAGREIIFIQNNSANEFVTQILNGIETLSRAATVAADDSGKYRTYVVNQDERKLRAFSIEISEKYTELFTEYSQKEDKNNDFKFKYDVFSEFMCKIDFPFLYLDELLRFGLVQEGVYLCQQLIRPYIQLNTDNVTDFVRWSGLYHLFMCSAVIFLRHSQYDQFRSNFYHLTFRNQYGKSKPIMDPLSFPSGYWENVALQIYKQNYYAKKFMIVCQNHLPSNISEDDFKTIDGFITLDLALHDLPYKWACGATVFYSFFRQIYYEHFDKAITTKEIAIKLIKSLINRYSRYTYDIYQGISDVIEEIGIKFKITNDDIKTP